MMLRAALLAVAAACAARAAQLEGRVVDAATGEPLARVYITVAGREVHTGAGGGFRLDGVPPGTHTLQASTVGYRPLRLTFEIEDEGRRSFELLLNADALRHREVVEVNAGPFAGESTGAVALAGSELRNLASVLTDDPLRAVQGLPGAAVADDFQSQFALRAAGFRRIGLYRDGILLHQPFHSVQGDDTSASVTLLNGDTLDSINLHPAAPSQFADRTAGIVDARSRDGRRDRVAAKATLSMSNVSGLVEGPLGAGKRGSWLVSARKSYLQYIIDAVSDEPALGFGFSDVSARAQYDVTRSHNVSLSLLHGYSALDRTGATFGPNAVVTSGYHSTLASAVWRYTPGASLLLTNRAAYLRERYENDNREQLPLASGGYAEWIGSGEGAWTASAWARIDFGWSARRARDDGYLVRRFTGTAPPLLLDQYRGAGVRTGAFLLPSFALASGKVQLTAGGRWDHHDSDGVHAFSPSASAAFQVLAGTRLSAQWMGAAQYPEISQLYSVTGRTSLPPERAIHVSAAVDQRLGERTRMRLEAYHRADRDLLFRPFAEPRILNGAVFNPPLRPAIANTQRGYARGAQIFLQRRTANGLTGWIAYAYGTSRVCDGVLNLCFPADFDQKHTVSLFASYRFRPTVNFSGRYAYGSGMPLRGFFQGTRDALYLSTDRNQVRLPYYGRLDLRANKAFIRDRYRLTLFAEVINITNRENIRLEDTGSYDPRTGRARPQFERTSPILPSVGLMIEF